MHKMLIKINEEKLKNAGLDPEGFKAFIDSVFEKTGGHIIKEVQPDGSMMYVGNPLYENYLCYFGMAYSKFKYNKDFLNYADKWIWLNDDDVQGDWSEEECLEHCRRLNKNGKKGI